MPDDAPGLIPPEKPSSRLAWYPWYPERFISSLRVDMMSLEEQGAYRLLLDFQWTSGKLPSERSEIFERSLSKILQIDIRRFRRIWKAIGFCFEVCQDDPMFMVNPQLERIKRHSVDVHEKRKVAGKLGGRPPGPEKQKVNSVLKPGLSKDSNNNKNKKGESSSDPSDPPNSLRTGNTPVGVSPEGDIDSESKANAFRKNAPRDLAWDTFAVAYIEHRKIPYDQQKKDFVQLARLRRRMNTPARQCPESWPQALRNYFDSELSAWTLADLCTRYDVFIAGTVDRYGKPAYDRTDKRQRQIDDWFARTMDEIDAKYSQNP